MVTRDLYRGKTGHNRALAINPKGHEATGYDSAKLLLTPEGQLMPSVTDLALLKLGK